QLALAEHRNALPRIRFQDPPASVRFGVVDFSVGVQWRATAHRSDFHLLANVLAVFFVNDPEFSGIVETVQKAINWEDGGFADGKFFAFPEGVLTRKWTFLGAIHDSNGT